jgi:hydroxyacylglutathione hydrolase
LNTPLRSGGPRRRDAAATSAPVPGQLQRLSPRVERLTQDNPGPFTGAGTNSYLIGDADAVYVLDPGARDEAHLERLLAAIAGRELAAILVSHAHPDHWPMAPELAQRLGAPILSFDARYGLRPDRAVREGEVLECGRTHLLAIHTPGHASDHLCFLLEDENALLCADHVMGWSTTIIAPPDGNLDHYLASLDRLIALEPSILYPGHGPAVAAPQEHMRGLRAHRQRRTEQVLATLARGPGTVGDLVEAIYAQADPKLRGAAAMSLRAHLDSLIQGGRVVSQGEGPEAVFSLR